MANIIYNYPKTSCNCSNYTNCKTNNDIVNKISIPTNMSIANCDFYNYNSCDSKNIEFKKGFEPSNKKGIDILNPQVINQGLGKDFQRRDNFGCKKSFVSTDPRLIRQPSNTFLSLDRPAYDGNYGKIKLSDINTNKCLTDSNTNYKTYSDIDLGQITYYIDKSIEDPYFEPNFINNTQITGEIFKDPMDSLKPQYIRQPRIYNPLKKKDKFQGNLSYIEDTLEHREDIMSLQMRKQNQQKWSSRWSK